MRDLREIVVHATLESNEKDLREMDLKHRRDGWFGCGYHYLIRKDGKVEMGRPIEQPGAHAEDFNKYSVGVCVLNNGEFTKRQWASLVATIASIVKVSPDIKVIGHRDCSKRSTKCPGFNVGAWWNKQLKD